VHLTADDPDATRRHVRYLIDGLAYSGAEARSSVRIARY